MLAHRTTFMLHYQALFESRAGSMRECLALCRYLLRVTVTRGYGASTEKDFFLWVRNYAPPPPPSNHPPIKVQPLAKPSRRASCFTRLLLG